MTARRKVEDHELIRLNSLGYSLQTISLHLGCHMTTVTHRLKELGVNPADTRRTFMEDILSTLPQQQLDWIANQLGPHISIKDYMKNLITVAYMNKDSNGKS